MTDRTNETVELSLEANEVHLGLDTDMDSLIHHEPWVWLDILTPEDPDKHPSFRVTLAEAGRLHDRLGLILGRDQEGLAATVKALTDAWDMTHFSCDNPDHSEAYRAAAVALGFTDTERS